MPPGLRDGPGHLPAAPGPRPCQQDRDRGERRAAAPPPRLERCYRQQRRDAADQERDGVDRADRRELRERAAAAAGCSRAAPGEREERVRARRTRAPSTGRVRRAGRAGPNPATRRAVAQPKSAWKSAKARQSATITSTPTGSAQPAVLDDDERRPVQQAQGRDRPGHVPEPRRPPARRARQGHQQRARAPPTPPPRARISGRRARAAGRRARPGPRCASLSARAPRGGRPLPR